MAKLTDWRKEEWANFLEKLRTREACQRCKVVGSLRAHDRRDDRPWSRAERLSAKTTCKLCGDQQEYECTRVDCR